MSLGPWTLRAGDAELGRLELVQNEMWNVTCQFVPAAGFEPWRARFERKAQLAGLLESSDDDELSTELDALDEATSPPFLTLVDEDGAEQDFGFLYIAGDAAGFRGM